MNTNNKSPYHLFCFVYLGFAQPSNKDFLEKEIDEIQKKNSNLDESKSI